MENSAKKTCSIREIEGVLSVLGEDLENRKITVHKGGKEEIQLGREKRG